MDGAVYCEPDVDYQQDLKHPLIEAVPRLLWSEKFGCILLYLNLSTLDLGMEPAVITDGSELCELLISEITSDVLEQLGKRG